jgi:MYXO-CTERM domain-containing protein
MFTSLLQGLASVVLAGFLCTAGAAPVQQSFTLSPDFGSFSGGSGSFSYDDVQVPDANGLVDLTGFSLLLDGKTFGLGDLIDAYAAFSGNSFIGLQVTIDSVLTMSPTVSGQDASFAYVNAAGDLAMGGIRFDAVGTVAEPGVASLALLALGGALALRRRRLTATA